jgi:hypothetical protein
VGQLSSLDFPCYSRRSNDRTIYKQSGAIGLVVIQCIKTKYGAGYHVWDVPPDLLAKYHVLAVYSVPLYQITLSLTKISTCFLYLRLFIGRKFRILVFCTMGWVVVYTIPCLVVHFVIGGHGPAPTSSFSYYPNAAANIATDIWLIVLIAPQIWGLRIDRKQKMFLLGILTLGWLCVIAAILRLVENIPGVQSPTDNTCKKISSSLDSF